MRQVYSWFGGLVDGAAAGAPELLVSVARGARRLAGPLVDLPAQVTRYEGHTPGGLTAKVLVAGSGGASRYFLRRIFADVDSCCIQRGRRIPLFKLPRTLRRMRDEADLVLADVDRLVSRRLFGDDYLRVPAWLLSTMPVSEAIEAPRRRNKSLQSHF